MARRKPPQEPEIFKQLPEPLLRALKELARMQIATDEAPATGNTNLYSEDNSFRPVAATQGPSTFQEAIGNSLRAKNLEIKTRELKGELAKQGFHLNDEQWINLLQYQIYLIQNQEMATSELRIQANKAAKRDEKERAYQQQELSLLQLAVRLIQEAQNLDQESNDHTYQNSYRLGEGFFTTSEWIDHPDRLLALINLGEQNILQFIAGYILPQKHWKTHPQLVTKLIKRAGDDQWTLKNIIECVLSTEYWANHSESPSWVTTLFQLAGNNQWVLRSITSYILSKGYWAKHPESPSLLTTLLQLAGNNQITLQYIAQHVLSKEYWAKYPESPHWITKLVQLAENDNDQITLQFIATHVLSKEYWANYSESPSWVTALIQQAGNNPWIIQFITSDVLSKEYWANHSESPSWVTTLIQLAGNNQKMLQFIALYVLSKEYWAKYPESPYWMTALIQQAGNDQKTLQFIASDILSKEYWRNHPQLKALVNWDTTPRSVTVENILAALARGKLLPSPLLPMLPTPPTAISTSQNSPGGGIVSSQQDPKESDAADTASPEEKAPQTLDFPSESEVQGGKE